MTTAQEESVAVPFKREDRYIVLKIKDLEQLNPVFLEELTSTLSAIANLTTMPQREFVVIESDWPEYETVWKMLGARVMGERCARQPASVAAKPETQGELVELLYTTIIQWDEGGGKRSRRELARRIAALLSAGPARVEPLTVWAVSSKTLHILFTSKEAALAWEESAGMTSATSFIQPVEIPVFSGHGITKDQA